VPRDNDGVAATLAPNVGLEVSRYPESWRQSTLTVGPPRGDDRASCTMPVTSVPDSDSRMRGLLDERSDRNVSDGLRSEALVVPKIPCSSGDVRPRSPPMSWVTAITTSVNSLWRTLYGGPSIPATAMTVEAGDVIIRQTDGGPCGEDCRNLAMTDFRTLCRKLVLIKYELNVRNLVTPGPRADEFGALTLRLR